MAPDEVFDAERNGQPVMLTSATEDFVSRLPGQRRDGPEYFQEPRGRWSGKGFVLAPGSTSEVAEILSACNAAKVPVLPYGGGTGLVGGQVSEDGPVPIILTMERMDKIREVSAAENVLVAEAGAILTGVQVAAAAAGRLFPLSLASEGSARIGGLLSTNAGGLNVLRYGSARAQVLGLEVVTPNGQIWEGLSRLRKDNTGYDLRDLYIGAEGTLGVITAASLRLMPRPATHGLSFMAVNGPDAALTLLGLAQDQVGEAVSGFELMHRQGLEFLAEVGPQQSLPLSKAPEWSVLIDLGLAEGQDPTAALEALFTKALEMGLVTDGVIASSETQANALWKIRESIPEANRRIGSIYSHDIALPLSRIGEFIIEGQQALERIAPVRINCFGHLGDGNLHYNVFPPKGQTRDTFAPHREAIKDCVYGLVHKYGGSISAEHGIGRLKTGDLERYSDPVKLSLMRRIKDALDPNGIMNPGAVLRNR